MGILLIIVKIKMQIRVISNDELAVFKKYINSSKRITPIRTVILFASHQA